MTTIVKTAAVLACLLTAAACAPRQFKLDPWIRFDSLKTTTPWEQDQEMTGRVQPEACRRDLSGDTTPVFWVSTRRLDDILTNYRVRPGHEYWGLYVKTALPGVPPGIYLDYGLDNPILAAIVLHHERCHVVANWDHSDQDRRGLKPTWTPTRDAKIR